MEQDVYIDQIHMDRVALRESVTPESVQQLAADIKQRGLLQAIVVKARDGGGWRLVAGRRRLTAAKSLGWTTIPARIIDSAELDEIDGLAENINRLQMSPVEEAAAVMHLYTVKNLSIREICERTGHGSSWVQDRMALHELPPHFKKAVGDKKIGIAAALQLMQIGQEDYRDYLLSVAIVNGATIHQCQAWLLDYQARSKLMNPTGQNAIEPQLPYNPPDPVTPCFLCEEPTPISQTVLIRLCAACNAEAIRAKAGAPPQIATATPGTAAHSNNEDSPDS